MNVHLAIAVTALCGMLLGLPAAQAQERSSMKRVRVDIGLTEGQFTTIPDHLTLRAGEYYRLELANWSEGIRHIVIAPEFAGAVATKAIRRFPLREEMKGASFGGGIDLPPGGGRVQVYFVPLKAGRYKLFCEDRGHTEAGVDVAIDVRL